MSLIEVEESAINDLEEAIKKQLSLLCFHCNERCKVEMQTSVSAEFERFLSRLS